MLRKQGQATFTTPIHMMSPGIGRIDIRRRSRLPNDPMYRAATPRQSRFPAMTVESKPSTSHGATKSSHGATSKGTQGGIGRRLKREKPSRLTASLASGQTLSWRQRDRFRSSGLDGWTAVEQ